MPDAVTAAAPGSLGNFGPGLDVLGCALTGACDTVTVQRRDDAEIVVLEPGGPELPHDPERHAAALAARAVLRHVSPRTGLAIVCRKELPLAGGQGGSAASAVAAAVAVNRLLGEPLGREDLLRCCLEVEATLAGRHLDNIAPSLLGGIVLVRSLDPIAVEQLPVIRELRIALVLPRQRLATAHARTVLPAEVPRDVVVHQMAQVSAIVHALHRGDLELLGAAMIDRIAEPVRAPLIPGFAGAKRAALAAGAIGASISGAGPTTFALCGDDITARRATDAMIAAYAEAGVAAEGRVAEVDETGAHVTGDAAP